MQEPEEIKDQATEVDDSDQTFMETLSEGADDQLVDDGDVTLGEKLKEGYQAPDEPEI